MTPGTPSVGDPAPKNRAVRLWKNRRRTTPVTSCGKGHPPNSREQSKLPKRSKGAGTTRWATNPRTGGRLTRVTAGTNPRTGQASRYVFTSTSEVRCPGSIRRLPPQRVGVRRHPRFLPVADRGVSGYADMVCCIQFCSVIYLSPAYCGQSSWARW